MADLVCGLFLEAVDDGLRVRQILLQPLNGRRVAAQALLQVPHLRQDG